MDGISYCCILASRVRRLNATNISPSEVHRHTRRTSHTRIGECDGLRSHHFVFSFRAGTFPAVASRHAHEFGCQRIAAKKRGSCKSEIGETTENMSVSHIDNLNGHRKTRLYIPDRFTLRDLQGTMPQRSNFLKLTSP